jgi:hypothetical protein
LEIENHSKTKAVTDKAVTDKVAIKEETESLITTKVEKENLSIMKEEIENPTIMRVVIESHLIGMVEIENRTKVETENLREVIEDLHMVVPNRTEALLTEVVFQNLLFQRVALVVPVYQLRSISRIRVFMFLKARQTH